MGITRAVEATVKQGVETIIEKCLLDDEDGGNHLSSGEALARQRRIARDRFFPHVKESLLAWLVAQDFKVGAVITYCLDNGPLHGEFVDGGEGYDVSTQLVSDERTFVFCGECTGLVFTSLFAYTEEPL